MVRATYNDTVIAETDGYEEVEGNIYFPPSSVNDEYTEESNRTSTCPWKGKASYYHVSVDGDTLQNAAWYYPDPKPDASHIKDYVAFNTDNVTIDEEA